MNSYIDDSILESDVMTNSINERNYHEEVIEILRHHYQICQGTPKPLKALKEHYGKGFKFEKLGLGKYGEWLTKTQHLFKVEVIANNLITELDHSTITEKDLFETINIYFNKSEMFYHRRHILKHIRNVYGEGSFASFGFGTFREFQIKHNLDMGIARQQDFKSLQDWYNWEGRKC